MVRYAVVLVHPAASASMITEPASRPTLEPPMSSRTNSPAGAVKGRGGVEAGRGGGGGGERGGLNTAGRTPKSQRRRLAQGLLGEHLLCVPLGCVWRKLVCRKLAGDALELQQLVGQANFS